MYLQQARQAVLARQATPALAALDQAQSIWIYQQTPVRPPGVSVEPEVLREMARARQAVEMGRWHDAAYYINAALTDPTVLGPTVFR